MEPSNNGSSVIISVYVESQVFLPNPNLSLSKPQTPAMHGYDRRARMLAYAQQLRHNGEDSSQQEWKRRIKKKRNKILKPRSEARKNFTSPWRLRPSFRRLFDPARRKWRYEQIATNEQGEKASKRNKATERSLSHICRRLRFFLKEVCCGWQCNRGSH